MTRLGNSAAAGRIGLDVTFAEADRRCRTQTVSAAALARRACARAALGDSQGAGVDLARALALEPDDVFALRAAMQFGDAQMRPRAAARWLAGEASDAAGFAAAAALRLDAGAEIAVQWRRRGGSLTGQAAWRGGGDLVVASERAGAVRRRPAPAEPLPGRPDIFRAEFFVEGEGEGDVWLELAGRPVTQRQTPPAPAPSFADAAAPAGLHVIVPVYRDLAATQACLESLFAQAESAAARIVIVDDAAPEAELRAYLASLAARPGVTLLQNPENLGFARSVNRALATCLGGDALWLNADTLLAPGALAALRRVAYARGDIGTVTPLSNNGEFTSFPLAFAANPLPPAEAVGAIARVAQEIHGERAVDLPNGVGFCLYVTRRCLEAVGPLPTLYRRGYYEDVEFCLRARERGFRNVCALGVYVGHAGARSFGADKRALVMRNLAALELRFPGHREEVAAFVSADPLAPARRALRAASPPDLAPPAKPPDAPRVAALSWPAPAAPLRLGVLAPFADARRDGRLVRLGRRLRAEGRGITVVVLGASLNDAEVTASGAVFVAGPTPPEDYAQACVLYRLGALADLSARQMAAPAQDFLADAPLPAASPLPSRPARHDFTLTPDDDDDALVDALTVWCVSLAQSPKAA